MKKLFFVLLLSGLGVFISLASYAQGPDETITAQGENIKPDFIKGDIVMNQYDGVSDDLLTGGLGAAGLANPTGPSFADPANPTAAEIRRLAIHTNHRGVADLSPGGGYGVLYGPTVDTDNPTGLIAGKEYLAFADDGSGRQNVALMVQIPDTFNPADPCIVTGPSSGSRGVYGAIGTSGEWGLKHDCAVAYTDKGTGTGLHDLTTDSVSLINGLRMDATTAMTRSNFTAVFTASDVLSPTAAVKHTHSQQNPEKDWGRNVLQAVEFAFYILNLDENFGDDDNGTILQTIVPTNTIVIASSISNGGWSSILAAEQDTKGLIDGAAVSEPNLNTAPQESLVIKQGAQEWAFPNNNRHLFDYFTLLNVYQPCADLAHPDAALNTAVIFAALQLAENRCAALADKGLLTKMKDGQETTAEERAAEAQQIINDYGILTNQNWIQPSQEFLEFNEAIAVTYAYAYGRFSVTDYLCGFSFAATNPSPAFDPRALTTTELAAAFSLFSGVPPGAGIQLINNNSLGGRLQNRFSLSATGVQEQNLEGALCLRRLATGQDEEGNPLTEPELGWHQRIIQGIAEALATGDLHGLPAIIVHGRDDAVVHPNHNGRAYFGVNQMVEGENSGLRYYEVLNAHHLDAFNGLPGFNERYVPLHYYFSQAMDMMYDHLKNGTALPPSQLIYTMPRGKDAEGMTPDITAANVPPIPADPTEAARITFVDNQVIIPETLVNSYLPIILKESQQ